MQIRRSDQLHYSLANQSNGSDSLDDTILPFLSNPIGSIHSLSMINRFDRSNGSHSTGTHTHRWYITIPKKT